jgi:hypothetical protein
LEVEALVGGGLLVRLADGGGEACRHEEPDAQVT